MTEYKLARRAAACMGCSQPFPEGATIVSAVFAKGEEFERRDLCEACFGTPPEAFSFWRTRQPASREERIRLDCDLARDFLRRLIREAEPARAGITYMVALLLSRKRRVKLLETVRTPDGETLRISLPGEEEDELVELRVPALSPEETARLQEELAGLFGSE